ncbi:MAG: UDP-N-acetylmuramoyl-L-alanine--D-glutamate ligase [Bacteroidetes bacterium]|nr:UDP-N-acetylmuramoyl-L-alanine--D-glutamate ligase [Bacteroidota bacterium]
MIASLKEYLEGKRILILGFGIEGRSSYNFLRKLLPKAELHIADQNNEHEVLRTLKDPFTKITSGKDYLEKINNFDLIFKSPGIKSDLIIGKTDAEISCQTDLFLRFYKDQIIGITGTKGKSTTSSLIAHIVKSSGCSCELIGNIGTPPFDVIDKIDKETIIVYEMSSHMLESVNDSPHIAIFLNIFPEHLDHYSDFEAYRSAKDRIWKFQNDSDFLIVNESLVHELESSRSKLCLFGNDKSKDHFGNVENGTVYLNNDNSFNAFLSNDDKFNLIGEHNLLNILAAFKACSLIGLTNPEILNGIKSFTTLEHRLEYIGKFRNIHFYNDSIATVPEACIAALDAIKDIDTLILGGKDRGLDYKILIERINNSEINNIILMGEVGKRLTKEFNEIDKRSIYANTLEEAFKSIWQYTETGKSCLLSPAASSYDQFRNFEERGNMFKKIARTQSDPC